MPEQQQTLTIQQAINLAVQHHKAGRLPQAESICKQILQSHPDQPVALHLLGVIAHQVGKNDDAVGMITKALDIEPDYAEAHNNLGSALLKLGKLEEAKISYRKALDIKPDYAEVHTNLGNTLKHLGKPEEAIASYNKAIELQPDFAEAHNNLGNALKELGKLEETAASYRQAIALKPDFAEAHYNLGLLFHVSEKYENAAEQFKLTSFKNSKYYLLRCFYYLDEKSRFFDLLDYFISEGKVDPVIGSLGCRSALRYGMERQNLFCKDPLKYVLKTNLNNQYDFEEIFVKTAKTILNENRLPKKRQGLLTNGYQTYGNLFDLEHDFTKEIQKIIRSEIEKYQVIFRDSEEGLIKSWPTEYSLNGWLLSMKSGGELQPHMHEKGWISGSIYINVPSKSKAESGNLVVCIEEDLMSVTENEKESIDVITGSLCLFPASLLHYTIPFESEEERIVLAFDVVPK